MIVPPSPCGPWRHAAHCSGSSRERPAAVTGAVIKETQSEVMEPPAAEREIAGVALPRIAIVDDDDAFAAELAAYLDLHRFEAVPMRAGDELLRRLDAEPFALVLLDQRLEQMTGTEVLRQLRRRSSVPCIVLTGFSEPVDRIVNLEMGADDEVDKSTSPRELLARIRSALRRAACASGAVPGTAAGRPEASTGSWTFSHARRELRRPDGSLCPLTTAEFDTFAVLYDHRGEAVSRAEISQRVFRRAYNPGDRAVDTVIRKLRAKLGDEPEPEIIKTVRPLGYVFTGFAPAGSA